MQRLLTIIMTAALTLSAGSIDFKEAPKVSKRVMPQSGNAILSYHNAIKNSTAAIVNIATTQQVTAPNIPQLQPFFEQFFGPGFQFPQQAPKRHSLGSGVIVSTDGYIITNNHVIDKADEIVVTLPGSTKEYEAKLIGTDPGTDVAVIKIDAEDLPAITIGSSEHLEVGDVVFAIGNPYGVGQTVTQGIISAQNKTDIGINKYENYIQTDASINPGNSGGALVDSRGALIGINTAIITRSGGNQGIGFAIEIDMVRDVAQKLIENGSIDRGYLGVSIEDLRKNMHKMYRNDKGALITDVMPDTPAHKAGFKRGDLIIEVNGQSITSRADLQNAIGRYAPGTRVNVTFERDKRINSVNVTLASQQQLAQTTKSDLLEGLQLSDLTNELRYSYHMPHNVEGVLVTNVLPDSEAAEQGIKAGDIIVQVEQSVITSLKDLADAVKRYGNGYKRVYLNRGGRVYITVLK
jgi:serine protease Do